jgi:hypothetical protein
MTYNELLKINKGKAQKEVTNFFGFDINENTAYHKIYDVSEKMNSYEHTELINNLIIKADYAGMNEELEVIKEAWEHFKNNEAVLNTL